MRREQGACIAATATATATATELNRRQRAPGAQPSPLPLCSPPPPAPTKLPCLARLRRYLEELQLQGLAKLRDKDLAPLAGLAGRLEQLSLRACKQLTSKALPCLAGLTRLRRLDLTGGRRRARTRSCCRLRGASGASGAIGRTRPSPSLALPARHLHAQTPAWAEGSAASSPAWPA